MQEQERKQSTGVRQLEMAKREVQNTGKDWGKSGRRLLYGDTLRYSMQELSRLVGIG